MGGSCYFQMKKIGAIIQCRTGSVRLPNKALKKLGGDPIISWVIERTLLTAGIDQVVLATSTKSKDDVLVELAEDLGVTVFRGDEDDVLDRYFQAAKHFSFDYIVRICADNPFVDPVEIGRLISNFRKDFSCYSCNHRNFRNNLYADGFGAEIFSFDALKQAHTNAKSQSDREHVTSFFLSNAADFKVKTFIAPFHLRYPNLSFDVDDARDLEMLRALCDLGVTKNSSAGSIIDVFIKKYQKSNYAENCLVNEIDVALHELFPLARSLTGTANEETLKQLKEIVPVKIKSIKSKTKVFDWQIPPVWELRAAWIKDANGVDLINVSDSNLHVVGYSIPFNKKMQFEELEENLFVSDKRLDAIPYRTSYFSENWGFCVTKEQFDKIKNADQPLEVFIDSEFDDNGDLIYGEYLLAGKSKKEILISTYFCHPSLANDNLSGTLLQAYLAQELRNMEKLNFSYRFVWVPETIGAIGYCWKNKETLAEIDFGLVLTTVAGPGQFGFKKSFEDYSEINAVISHVLNHETFSHKAYPFDVHGSDERQYSSQAFRINICSITKDKYYEYSEYHTSKDNLEFISAQNLANSLHVYKEVIEGLEASNKFFKVKNPHCEAMLSKHNLYPKTGGAILPNERGLGKLDIILWVLFLCDGKRSVTSIAYQIGAPAENVVFICEELVNKGLLEQMEINPHTGLAV